MEIPPWLEDLLMAGCDEVFRIWPQPRPSDEQLSRCKIIAHRGAHNRPGLPENTLAAFQVALAEPEVSGIELDVRWTRDLVPMVFHDADLLRMFGEPRPLASFTATELKERFPLIPTLQEAIDLCRGRAHLMIEIKDEPYPQVEQQNRILSDLLQGWQPQQDFHLLLLDPEIADKLTFAPRSCMLLVAFFNVEEFHQHVQQQGFGGMGGHYLLVRDAITQDLLEAGRFVGTGYPKSRNALFRELNRGVEWVFSNDAVELARLLRQAREFR
jgi:glycerophosphoryl diester phosphodiesterase